MEIRPLTWQDAPAYLAYRREMWPASAAAGDWEAVAVKYFENPLAAQSPGSGLYGYFDADSLLGIWGAYPMPVTLDGALYPGHLLVDSYVLERCRNLPIGGLLFRTVRSLPGRKYASYGSEGLQQQLARIAFRIESASSMAIWRFAPALMTRAWKLAPGMQPLSVSVSAVKLPPRVRIVSAAEVRSEEPPEIAGEAFVRRDAEFWRRFCACRVKNGAIPLEVRTANAEARAMVRLVGAGKVAMAYLVGLTLQPYSLPAAREVGRELRAGLDAMGAGALLATEPDAVWRALQDAAGTYVRRAPAHWWSIRSKGDTFDAAAVKWRLTYADRDSSWGGLQPSAAS